MLLPNQEFLPELSQKLQEMGEQLSQNGLTVPEDIDTEALFKATHKSCMEAKGKAGAQGAQAAKASSPASPEGGPTVCGYILACIKAALLCNIIVRVD